MTFIVVAPASEHAASAQPLFEISAGIVPLLVQRETHWREVAFVLPVSLPEVNEANEFSRHV